MIWPLRWLLMLTSCMSPVVCVAFDDEEYLVPVNDIRKSAQRILSDPDFQTFDHFGDADVGPASSPAPEGSTFRDAEPTTRSTTGAPSSRGTRASREAGTTPQPSGDADQRPSGKSESGSGSGSDAGSTTSATPEPSTAPEAPSEKTTSSTSPTEPRHERYATKTTSSGIPSLRGHDGVERPVRFAPKPKTPPKPPKWDWQWDWSFDMGLGEFFSGFGTLLSGSIQVLAYAALVAVCGLILFLAARAIGELIKLRRQGPKFSITTVVPLADDRSPGEIAADVYLQQALALAEQGRYREALGQLILGAMSAIERQQWIRYRRGLTLHDYLRSVRSRPTQYQGLQTVAAVYEPVEYGRRMASADLFTQALDGYRSGFKDTASP